MNLFQFIGYQYDVDIRTQSDTSGVSEANKQRYPQFGPFGLCTLDYTFQTMWRLVNQLPPTLQSFKEIIQATEADKPIDASRIINMCIWLPRLENSRASFLWVRELLTKASTNSGIEASSDSPTTAKSMASIEETINELLQVFGSMDFNYSLLKCLSWNFFHYNHCINNQLFQYGNVLGHDMASHLLQLKLIHFPKFFTLFTMDFYMERVISLFFGEFQKVKSFKNSEQNNVSDGTSPDEKHFDTIEKYILLLLGLFDKLFIDINAILVYDGPLASFAEGQNSSTDLKYLFYRCLVNICSTNCYDASVSDITSNIVNFLPQNILSRIDQWNRLYANTKQIFALSEIQQFMQLGSLFEVPLVSLQPSGSKQANNYLYNFSSFINEKYLICDLPNVNSVDPGSGNLSWLKLKQVWVKLFKFLELIYW